MMKLEKFIQEVEARAKHDLDHRQLLIDEGRLTDGYDPEMEKIHIDNAAWLEKWVDESGWPDIRDMGNDAWESLRIIILHAIPCPAFMRKAGRYFNALKDADLEIQKFAAALEDRIRHHEGRPQLYGMIVDWNDSGQLCIPLMEDVDAVNVRRQKLGLPSVEQFLRDMQREELKPPSDAGRKKQGYHDWLKRRGWR